MTRPLEVGDLDTIAEIHWEAARVVYAYRDWRYSLAEVRDWYAGKFPDWDWGRIALAAGPSGASLPVGFAVSIGPFLDQLFVLPAYQRVGIGRLLLAAMLARGLRPIRLHVLKGNAPARAFYESHRFLLERTWWDSGEDETVMLYRLD
jgi:putative acetyltransferase